MKLPNADKAMIDQPIHMLDVVALLHHRPDHGLSRGHVGTVVEELAPGVFEVEFCDNEGHSYASLALRAQDVIVLHYQPVEAEMV